jgi:hypothetical protein
VRIVPAPVAAIRSSDLRAWSTSHVAGPRDDPRPGTVGVRVGHHERVAGEQHVAVGQVQAHVALRVPGRVDRAQAAGQRGAVAEALELLERLAEDRAGLRRAPVQPARRAVAQVEQRHALRLRVAQRVAGQLASPAGT